MNLIGGAIMHKCKYFLFMLSFLLCGCATQPERQDPDFSGPLIQIPVQSQGATVSSPDDSLAFSDVSLSMKKRITAMTTNAEIQKDTNDFVKNGQAEVITRPDGTIIYPYGLAEVNLTTKRMMYSKIVLQEGEKIMSVASGDTVRWNILPSYIGDVNSYTPVVLVKPFMGGLQTSLSIITDKRDYDITIQSVERGDFMQRIGF
ncbi:MAG: TrbG/VirB9 family P-type conjugative transfer protein, partial [Candidatus Omnitrophica bacterium]|nr:TrbG/VirB9 family P-type conjugative transfer protein [Candidatus Omnitrophota bacterium]